MAQRTGGNGWYQDAAAYWASVEATDNGMLGGYEALTERDVASSLRFIEEFVKGRRGLGRNPPRPPRIASTYACDCGAGIGRVSKHFLLKVFERVDLVEQDPAFLAQARDTYLGPELLPRVGEFINLGLQLFNPERNRYDLIWTQWVLGHLTDNDFVAFFERCMLALKPGGLIGVKENVTAAGIEVDEEDSSVTRSDELLKSLWERAGLRVIKEDKQKGFPSHLYGVKM
ncbi:alpha-N-methyltransferase NTM1 [Cladochytrium replicatum]|nr:alpha-N-methyltransferase NTM1 [Cladochytrium replicatum]